VKHASLAEQMREHPTAMPQYLDTLAALQARIHAHLASQFGSLKLRLATNFAQTNLLDEARKGALLTRLADMPEGDRLCHGDFHPINVLGEVSPLLVIDWPDACRGDPAADVCRSYLLLKLHAEGIADPYLDTYCRINNEAPQNFLDWLPYVAAARLAEDVPGERDRLLEFLSS
jgi:Ser/Thr protein kinase RdoA (MazF antagonist)